MLTLVKRNENNCGEKKSITNAKYNIKYRTSYLPEKFDKKMVIKDIAVNY